MSALSYFQAEVVNVSGQRQSADRISAAKWQVERGFAMAKGRIKKLVGDKGYGFIQTEDGKELFFHLSQLQGMQFSPLTEGQEVEYKAGLGPWWSPGGGQGEATVTQN